MNWIADQETSAEQVIPCMFFCLKDLISTQYVMDKAFITGSTAHLIYFWLKRMDRFWKFQPDWVKYGLLLFLPFLLYVLAFAFAAASIPMAMMLSLFLVIIMVFATQAVPLIPFPLFPGYAVGRHHKWSSAASIVFGFCVFALITFTFVFVLEYYTAAMNSRYNKLSPQGVDTFWSQYISILALGVPFVAFMTLSVHDSYNDLANYIPVNPAFYKFGSPTPLQQVRAEIRKISHDTTDKSYERELMLKFFRNGGAHRQLNKYAAP